MRPARYFFVIQLSNSRVEDSLKTQGRQRAFLPYDNFWQLYEYKSNLPFLNFNCS